MEPSARVDARAGVRRVAGRTHDVREPATVLERTDSARADQHDVAGSHLDARPRSRLVEFVTRDLVAAGELVDSSHRSDIEEHAAADKRAHVLDPEHGRTAERGDGVGRDTVVQRACVADMAECVPVGRSLQTHHDMVVVEVGDHGVAVGVAEIRVVDVVHRPQWVDPAGYRTDLGSVRREIDRHRDPPARTDCRRSVGNGFVGEQVERAEAVVVTPPAPVADFGTDLVEAIVERHGPTS